MYMQYMISIATNYSRWTMMSMSMWLCLIFGRCFCVCFQLIHFFVTICFLLMSNIMSLLISGIFLSFVLLWDVVNQVVCCFHRWIFRFCFSTIFSWWCVFVSVLYLPDMPRKTCLRVLWVSKYHLNILKNIFKF